MPKIYQIQADYNDPDFAQGDELLTDTEGGYIGHESLGGIPLEKASGAIIQIERKKYKKIPSILMVQAAQELLLDPIVIKELTDRNLLSECRTIPFVLYRKKFKIKIKEYHALVFEKEYTPIDDDKSEFMVLGPVKILQKAVFHAQKIPDSPIFKVGLKYYCNQQFKDCVTENNFDNFLFEEIEQS